MPTVGFGSKGPISLGETATLRFRRIAQQKFLCVVTVTIGIYWAIGFNDFEHPDQVHSVVGVAGIVLLALLARNDRLSPGFTLAYASAVALAARYGAHYVGGSDVLVGTDEALSALSRGENPYSHVFQRTVPPGGNFAYFPGNLYYYAIAAHLLGSILNVDVVASGAIIVSKAHCTLTEDRYDD